MKEWLMLRGFWDKNNRQNIADKTDMWVSLFEKLVGDDAYDDGVVFFVSKKRERIAYSPNITIITGELNKDYLKKFDYIFARGAHPEYIPILKKCKNAYKIYYGAGKRINPKDGIKYNLILVDTVEQKIKVQRKHPKSKVSLWIKPAAKHFKPVVAEKKYDVCYVAQCSSPFQEKIKRVEWVYKTAPKDLKILHLGKSGLKPPKNVTVKNVSRLEMPKYYSQCKVGVVPYKSYDSMPRVIPEMLACGLPVVVMDSVNVWVRKYSLGLVVANYHSSCGCIANKYKFWKKTQMYKGYIDRQIADDQSIGEVFTGDPLTKVIYQDNLSLKPAAEHIRKLING